MTGCGGANRERVIPRSGEDIRRYRDRSRGTLLRSDGDRRRSESNAPICGARSGECVGHRRRKVHVVVSNENREALLRLQRVGPSVNFANQVNINITSLDLETLGRDYTTTGNKGLSALKTGGSDSLDNAKIEIEQFFTDADIVG